MRATQSAWSLPAMAHSKRQAGTRMQTGGSCSRLRRETDIGRERERHTLLIDMLQLLQLYTLSLLHNQRLRAALDVLCRGDQRHPMPWSSASAAVMAVVSGALVLTHVSTFVSCICTWLGDQDMTAASNLLTMPFISRGENRSYKHTHAPFQLQVPWRSR